MRREDGFSLLEGVIVMVVIAILVALAIPTFLGTKVTARNNEMRAAAANLAKALTAYNADYPIYPNPTGAGCCIDPLAGRNGTEQDPSASGPAVIWSGTNHKVPASGLVGKGGRPLVADWPRHPWLNTPAGVLVYPPGMACPATAGFICVTRPAPSAANPRGAFAVRAYGQDRAGTPIVVFRMTVEGRDGDSTGPDCGYLHAPPCP